MTTGTGAERRSGEGDGSALAEVGPAAPLWRAVMGADHGGVRYDIDVDLWDPSERVRLYRDGIQYRVQPSPARFELDDGSRIEVAYSTFGLRRAHLVGADGTTRMLEPAPGTGERWRADLDRERPGLSRLISVLSWTVLAVALLVELPQLVEQVAQWTGLFEFSSPVNAPPTVNGLLTVLGVVAGIERALRLRYNALLDE